MINQPENQFQQPSGLPTGQAGGPQFGIEQKKEQGRIKGWLNRYGSSVILPIVALLILAGGIYLYASRKGQPEILPLDENSTGQLSLNPQGEPVITDESSSVGETTQETSENPVVIGKAVSESRSEGDKIVVKAGQGDGVTHLSRRALSDYLRENPQQLSNEQKIYIEDYLKDKIGSRPLEVGEEIGFSNDLINEAVDASTQLDQDQLKSLEKYSASVVWQ